jgi:hypothetical protein
MIIDAKSAFGFLMDGSDETAKFNAAVAATVGLGTGNTLYFDGGVIGLNGPAVIGSLVHIVGAGRNKTVFKNLSTDKRMFDVNLPISPAAAAPYYGVDYGAAFSTLENFSIDQNGCSKSAIRFNTMYCGMEDVWVHNHGGGAEGEYAVNINNATHFSMIDCSVTNSDNCLNIENSYYVSLVNVPLERQKGRALRVDACIQFNAASLYLDHGNPAANGNNVPEMAVFRGVSGLLLNGISTEIAPGAGLLVNNIHNAPDDPRRAYILFDSVEAGEVNGFAVSHSAGGSSAVMASIKSSSIAFSGTKWTEWGTPNMVLFYIHSDNLMFSADNTTTRCKNQSGAVYGIGAWAEKSDIVHVARWKDINSPATLSMHADNLMCEQVLAPIDLFSVSTKATLINCANAYGAGYASAAKLNS